MAKFVVYEIYSRARVVEARTPESVYDSTDPVDDSLYGVHGLSFASCLELPTGRTGLISAPHQFPNRVAPDGAKNRGGQSADFRVLNREPTGVNRR